MKEFIEKVIRVQANLTVPKDRYNDFGGFKYRNGDDILKAAKPVCAAEGLLLTLTDAVIENNGHSYIEATATLTDGENSISVNALAREEPARPKMADPMLTGSASSYARKYAMNGLFGLDDDSDPDNLNNSHVGQQTSQQRPPQQQGNRQSTGNGVGPANADLQNLAREILMAQGKTDQQIEAMIKNPDLCRNIIEGKIK